MSTFSNALEVFRLLPKNNCRDCGEKTCLAFAGAVFLGQRQLSQCPHVKVEIAGKYSSQYKKTSIQEEDFQRNIAKMKSMLKELDLAERAKTIGATYDKDKLVFNILGKPFKVNKYGDIFTDLHANHWVLGTAFSYINLCEGVPLSGNWVPLRELPSGKDWYRLFGQQCELILKNTADTYSDLFEDLVRIFSGRQIAKQFDSDIALILSPFPLVPMLICYWKPEDGMESSLNLFFDDTAERNMGIDALYSLGVGIAKMLEKLARQHGEM
jgi:hypothetical protein